ncbi:MAG: hypothetical protein IJ044_01990, partial [Oscillospiraceae bacterium]|nr:hypothetical protein [Oscillospiraceae bacterium]
TENGGNNIGVMVALYRLQKFHTGAAFFQRFGVFNDGVLIIEIKTGIGFAQIADQIDILHGYTFHFTGFCCACSQQLSSL